MRPQWSPMSCVDESLPHPDAARGPHLIDYLEALLIRCVDLANGRDWAQLAAVGRSDLDAIRESTAADAPDLGVFDFAAEPVREHLAKVLASFGGADRLIAAAACARAVDDVWGDELASEWPSFVARRDDRIAPGDIVLSAGSDHIADIYSAGTALAANRLRASDHPGRTRRASLFVPQSGVPPIQIDRSLHHVLAPLLARQPDLPPRCWVAAVPNATSDEWDHDSLPIRPRDQQSHIEACVQAFSSAVDSDAAVVVLPEFSGFVNVVDRLRQLRPNKPTLIVAGSGHDATGGGLRNVASTWVARADGTVPTDHPVRTLKRVPYAGALGTEALTEVATSITLLLSGPWRLAIGICRDLCDPAISDALAQLGVNLLLIPACSPKTTNLARGAEAVAVDAGGFALVANGPPRFNRTDAAPVEVDTAIWCTPLDRTSPRLMGAPTGAGLVFVDLANHALIPVAWS